MVEWLVVQFILHYILQTQTNLAKPKMWAKLRFPDWAVRNIWIEDICPLI